MPRKDRPTGPLTSRAARSALARVYAVRSRLTAAELDALHHFHFGGQAEYTMTGTEVFDGYDIPKDHPARKSNFFQNVNCGSGVIRR